MCGELIHIYGPFSIHSYGLMIVIGILIAIFLIQRNPVRKKIINKGQLVDAITIAVLSGLIGARILYVVCNWQNITSLLDVVSVWDGGISLLGSIIGGFIGLLFYLWRIHIPKLVFFDLISLYVPLIQAFGRIGCFLAGCCYGKPTTLPWGICCTSDRGCLHPAQLYSAAMLFFIFLFLMLCAYKRALKPGQLISLYLMLIASERFFVDFFRGDREFLSNPYLNFLSIHQYLAVAILFVALIGFIRASTRKTHSYEYI